MEFKKNTYFILLFTLIFSTQGFGQMYDGITMNAFKEEIVDISFARYSNPYKIKASYKNERKAKLNTPEELMTSLISANNQKWFDNNFLFGELESIKKGENHFDFIKKMDVESNYFNLIYKVTVMKDTTQYAFLKYGINAQGLQEEVPAVKSMKKKGGKWYLTPSSDFAKFSLIFIFFDDEKLEKLLFGPWDSPEFVEAKSKVFENDLFNLGKLNDFCIELNRNPDSILYNFWKDNKSF